MTDQDARLVGRAWAAGRGVVVLANKWDAVPPERRDARAFREALADAHPAFAGLPILCVSARTGEGLGDLFPAVARVESAYEASLPTPAVNKALAEAVASHPPPSPRGRALRFLYATQTGRRPPAITVFANAPELVPAAYTRYLTNQLTETFHLAGVPLQLTFRARAGRPPRPRARRRGTDASRRRRQPRR
jgi:GTPase